jgi:4-hydroxy-tetrahydrodipicolinate synthase
MQTFGPIITAMVTPFKQDKLDEIDYVAAAKILAHLAGNGSQAVVISGTTGERPTLTHEEEESYLKFIVSEVKKNSYDLKVIFGSGSNCTETAKASSKRAQHIGADALLLVTPYYNKPTQAGLAHHSIEIASAVELPVILYNVPSRSVVSLDYETIVEIKTKADNIIGIKEASDNFELITRLRRKYSKDEFAIFSGEDGLYLPMLSLGINGIISVCSHIYGNEMLELTKMYLDGKPAEALEINNSLYPAVKAIFCKTNPIGIKAALSLKDLCANRLRSPLLPLNEVEIAELKESLV